MRKSYAFSKTGIKAALIGLSVAAQALFMPVEIITADDTTAAGTDTQVVTFGSYEQNNDPADGSEPIEWYVLDRTGDSALLLSKNCLDYMVYHDVFTYVTWETCSLRQWMNSEFLNAAFSDAEQAYIIPTELVTKSNSISYAPGGNNTIDQVFLLSSEEAKQYLTTIELLTGTGTEYSYAKGLKLSKLAKGETAEYRLRSPGTQSDYAASCNIAGVSEEGFSVDMPCGVRPAVWVDADALK
ncbi:MAG: DUF6273 domain-containing protein [Lachnospiraceae bacterium]|nr:DUF6273 domain-containing protein [Lachnospiraceae bacterium]